MCVTLHLFTHLMTMYCHRLFGVFMFWICFVWLYRLCGVSSVLRVLRKLTKLSRQVILQHKCPIKFCLLHLVFSCTMHDRFISTYYIRLCKPSYDSHVYLEYSVEANVWVVCLALLRRGLGEHDYWIVKMMFWTLRRQLNYRTTWADWYDKSAEWSQWWGSPPRN